MRYFARFLMVAAFLLQIDTLYPQDGDPETWYQFRGPNRNGTFAWELPDALPDQGPKLLWKKEIGEGFSEMAVAGGRIFTMFGEQTDSTSGHEYLAAFNALTGEELWRAETDSLFFDEFGNGPRSTPLVDGGWVYCLSSYGKLSAFDAADGKSLWKTDLVADLGSTLPRWGFSTSPVLIDGILVLEAGGSESRGFVGIDKTTGKVLWERGAGVAYYSSPVVAEIEGEDQVLFASQTMLYAFNSAGDTLWTCPVSMNGPMATPVVFGNRIFISTVRSEGFCIVEVLNGRASEILRGGTMKNDFSSSLYHDGYIYGFDVAALQCISAVTGEKKWTKRGFGKGSLILVKDKLLVMSDKGKLIQVKATPDAYTEQGSFQALDGKSWTAPSFTGGKLYVRNLAQMACYDFQ